MQITLTLDLTEKNLQLLNELRKRLESDEKPAEAPKVTAETPEELPYAAKETPKPEEKPASKTTLTDLRAKALTFSRGGKADVLRAIFEKFGANKLSEIKEEDYDSLMKEMVNANA